MPLPNLQNNNREMVHLQTPEYVCFQRYANTASGSFWVYDKSNISPFAQSHNVTGVSAIFSMNMRFPQGGMLQIPASGIA